ncbi:hypothetical protein C8Q79DRAFT_769192 [Trametes meyenii]|nr:hypothetical protein C8Q79DRAFT_769192 [Trametes meyenii]
MRLSASSVGDGWRADGGGRESEERTLRTTARSIMIISSVSAALVSVSQSSTLFLGPCSLSESLSALAPLSSTPLAHHAQVSGATPKSITRRCARARQRSTPGPDGTLRAHSLIASASPAPTVGRPAPPAPRNGATAAAPSRTPWRSHQFLCGVPGWPECPTDAVCELRGVHALDERGSSNTKHPLLFCRCRRHAAHLNTSPPCDLVFCATVFLDSPPLYSMSFIHVRLSASGRSSSSLALDNYHDGGSPPTPAAGDEGRHKLRLPVLDVLHCLDTLRTQRSRGSSDDAVSK